MWLSSADEHVQYIPRNMHTVFAVLCFVVVIHWLIFPYPSGLLHWHCGNLTIAPVPAAQPWWIWINTSCEFIMNDCITTTKQNTTKPCAYFLGYTVWCQVILIISVDGIGKVGLNNFVYHKWQTKHTEIKDIPANEWQWWKIVIYQTLVETVAFTQNTVTITNTNTKFQKLSHKLTLRTYLHNETSFSRLEEYIFRMAITSKTKRRFGSPTYFVTCSV